MAWNSLWVTHNPPASTSPVLDFQILSTMWQSYFWSPRTEQEGFVPTLQLLHLTSGLGLPPWLPKLHGSFTILHQGSLKLKMNTRPSPTACLYLAPGEIIMFGGCLFAALEMNPQALRIGSKHPTAEPHPQPPVWVSHLTWLRFP